MKDYPVLIDDIIIVENYYDFNEKSLKVFFKKEKGIVLFSHS
jgi:hypothetical protein